MSEIITSEIEISAGVISSGLTVDTNGVVTVLSGGTVTDTEAVNLGYLVVESGGFARDLTMRDGGDVLVLGEAENLTMKDGGQMDVMEGVMRSGTILNNGYGMVYAGASGLNVTVSSGGRYLVYGGYVGNTVVLLIMQTTPMIMKGMLRICPISKGRVASKASCISLVYSIKKRNVKIYVRQKPKYQPLPTCSFRPLAFFL